MPDPDQLNDFLEALGSAGSPAKNPALREAPGWEEPLYEEVKAELVAKGIVVRGRGRSDSVSLVGAEPVAQAAAPASNGRKAKASGNGTANLGFEAKLWLTADKLRDNMDAAEYKHVVLGLIFLKYIAGSFEEHRRLDPARRRPRPDPRDGQTHPQQIRLPPRSAGRGGEDRAGPGGAALRTVGVSQLWISR